MLFNAVPMKMVTCEMYLLAKASLLQNLTGYMGKLVISFNFS